MSGVGRSILTMVGDTSAPSSDAPRRKLAREDLAYAGECRARGWGWQAIAHQLRCNEIDLRRECGDPSVPPKAAPKPQAPPPLMRSERVLLAIAHGAVSRADVRDATGLDLHEVNSTLVSLCKRGSLNALVRGVGWTLTDKGRERAVRLGCPTEPAGASDDA